MRKKLTAAALALVMVLSMVPAALAAEASPTNDKLTVDGVAQNPTVYKIGGSNYFKIRDLAAILNGTSKQFAVGYDASTSSVTATTGEGYTKTDADLAGPPAGGSKSAELSGDVIYVNGVRTEAEVYKIDGNNYFKLRDLGDALGFAVDWNAEQGMIINTGDSSVAAPPADGKVTLDDLQGVWYRESTGLSFVKNYVVKTEYAIQGDQVTVSLYESGDSIKTRLQSTDYTGTVVESENLNTAKHCDWDVKSVGKSISRDAIKGTTTEDEQSASRMPIVSIYEVNLTEGYFIDGYGHRYDKVPVAALRDEVRSKTPSSPASTGDTSNGSGYYAAWPQVRDLGAFTGVAPYSVSQSGNATRYKYSIAELAIANPNFITEYADLIMKDGFYRSHSYDIRNGTDRVGKGIVFEKGKISLVFKYDSTEGSGLGTVTIVVGTDPF